MALSNKSRTLPPIWSGEVRTPVNAAMYQVVDRSQLPVGKARMTISAEKLAASVDTVRLAMEGPTDPLAECLVENTGRPAILIGSGGPAITAEDLARYRSTVGHGQKVAQIPIHLIVARGGLTDQEVWLLRAAAADPTPKRR